MKKVSFNSTTAELRDDLKKLEKMVNLEMLIFLNLQ